MLWCYDNAIANDLKRSLSPDGQMNPVVKVCDQEGVIELIAQMQEDEISFPIIVITRNPNTPVDKTRTNFTKMKRGVPVCIDGDTNNVYYEKVIPIELGYELTVLATNTADMDELVKELLFKYMETFFIKFQLPYEYKKMIRFGITVDGNTDISRKSGYFEYIQGGILYQTIISLKCEGAVLVSYTPQRLKREDTRIELE